MFRYIKTFIVLLKYLLEYLFYLFVVYNFVKSSQESYVTLCNVYPRLLYYNGFYEIIVFIVIT